MFSIYSVLFQTFWLQIQRTKAHQRTKATKSQNQNFTGLNLSCNGLFQLNTTVLQLNLSQQYINFFFMGSIIEEGTAIPMSKLYFSPAKFFKFEFLPLVKDHPGEYYPILSDRYVLPVWVGFLAIKNSLKPGMKLGTEEVKANIKPKTG